jgi:hypothetical protein
VVAGHPLTLAAVEGVVATGLLSAQAEAAHPQSLRSQLHWQQITPLRLVRVEPEKPIQTELEITVPIQYFPPSLQLEAAGAIRKEMGRLADRGVALAGLWEVQPEVREPPTKDMPVETAFPTQQAVEAVLGGLGQMAHQLQMAATVALGYRPALQAHLLVGPVVGAAGANLSLVEQAVPQPMVVALDQIPDQVRTEQSTPEAAGVVALNRVRHE